MLLCALSGILLGITFVFKELCFLSLFALIPFIFSISKEGRGFLKGVVFSVCINGVALSFFSYMQSQSYATNAEITRLREPMCIDTISTPYPMSASTT